RPRSVIERTEADRREIEASMRLILPWNEGFQSSIRPMSPRLEAAVGRSQTGAGGGIPLPAPDGWCSGWSASEEELGCADPDREHLRREWPSGRTHVLVQGGDAGRNEGPDRGPRRRARGDGPVPEGDLRGLRRNHGHEPDP